ncbi:MAG: AtpZ/AtpI family protein [Lentimicrobium sp.]|jgi:F0F1-type ATP synthase assembly protein I|nr:AtpZ/AtpI family protein [Lentimicrobium sp.]
MKKPQQNKNQNYSSYARYSALAIQAGVIIFAGTFGGYKLDAYLNLKFPIFTLVLSLLSVFAAIWLLIRDVLKKNKPK